MPGGIDKEVVTRISPEPVTEREARYMKNIDPTDLGIFSHRVEMITSECKEILLKLGASTGCRWGDIGFGIYTSSGDNAMASAGIYFHTILGQIPLKYIIKHWAGDPSVGIKPGDAFFSNDPLYGGVHGCDMGLYVPIFHKGEIVCWAASVIHTGENGSCEPGGAPISSRSKYDEGLLIPPIKICENYQLKEDIMNMICHMVRDPRSFTLDIKARLAACRLGEKRVSEVINEKGVNFVIGAIRAMIEITADAARARLREYNDGVFQQVRWSDAVGTAHGLLKITITMEKRNDSLFFDFTNTSPHVSDHPCNSRWIGVLGVSAIYFCGYLFPDLPSNAGLLAPLKWKVAENTVVNPGFECPTGNSPFVQISVEQGIHQLCSKLIFANDADRAMAPGYSGFNMAYFGGINQFGEPIADMSVEINGAGYGATRNRDGVDVAGAVFAPQSDSGDAESEELHLPFLYLYRGFLQNSFGHGKFRGGAGLNFAIEVHNVPPPFFGGLVFLGGMGFGSKMPTTQGMFGGYAIATIPFVRISRNNLKELWQKSDPNIPSSTRMLFEKRAIQGSYRVDSYPSVVEPMMNGDVVVGALGGGGGYGDAIERDPQLVMQDLQKGLISHWVAKNVYKVVYDEDTLLVDSEKTKFRREQELADRKSRGLSYNEFEKEWLKMKPKDEVLKFYGSWPHPAQQ